MCKRATGHAAEAMECLGGNGYVEESGMPRLYREAPLMGIWEGSGNVSALDTLRAMATRPESIDVLFDELAKSTGQDPRLDAHIDGLKPQFDDLESIQYRARKVTEDIGSGAAGLAAGAARASGRRRSVPRHPDGRPVGRRLRNHARRTGSRADPRAGPGQRLTSSSD